MEKVFFHITFSSGKHTVGCLDTSIQKRRGVSPSNKPLSQNARFPCFDLTPLAFAELSKSHKKISENDFWILAEPIIEAFEQAHFVSGGLTLPNYFEILEQ